MRSLSANISNVGVVILHRKLADSVIVKLLHQKQIKCRTSERLLNGVVIFAKAKLAFLVVDISEAKRPQTYSNKQSQISDNKNGFTEIVARIDKFIKMHGQCVVILQAPLFTLTELETLSQLQSKYMHKNVDFLPAHNADDCVDAMLTMASVHTLPASEVLRERVRDLVNSLLEPPAFLSNFKKI